jgi:hypothetical protein
MNLRNHILNNPGTLMMIGMICLVLSGLPSFVHVLTSWNPDAVDFARGVLLGVFIGLNLVAVWRFAHRKQRT